MLLRISVLGARREGAAADAARRDVRSTEVSALADIYLSL